MSKPIDPIEFRRMLYLGSQVAKKHPPFQELAKLGYKEAEVYSFFQWLRWLDKKENINASFEDGILKLIEFLGMAHFLENTKELTRLSMIMGDTRKTVIY